MASCLGFLLWNTLTVGHPLRGGFPLAFLGLTLVVLAVLFLAALPRRPGEPAPPAHTRIFVWLPCPVALTSLLLIVSELHPHPRLWPLLLLPLTGLALAFLGVRGHLRRVPDEPDRGPAPKEPRRYPVTASQRFGTAALMTTFLSHMLFYLLHTGHLPGVRPGSTLILLFLVAVLAALALQTAEPALPPRFSGSARPPMVNGVFTWLAWFTVPVSVMPSTVVLVEPQLVPSFWPFALFPASALVLAFLTTHAYFRERVRQPEEEEAA
ncbi:hypothetical protein [Nocardiopsis ganjiahuensis]|uniref:hypothetical protein n=1 Tax=Nocardiopsis ganjiahuensis TaxID=239984 RepID=UPI00034D3031|nr:hypothetical protein [Nocardiopsis ganjiahuensis]